MKSLYRNIVIVLFVSGSFLSSGQTSTIINGVLPPSSISDAKVVLLQPGANLSVTSGQVTQVFITDVNINPTEPTMFSGGSVTLSASGGVSYKWSTGATTASIIVSPASSTTYSVTIVNQSGNTLYGALPVTVIPPPGASITPTNCDTCIGIVQFTPGKQYVVDVWAKDHSSSPTDTTYLNPEVNVTFTGTGSGNATFGPFRPQGGIIDGWQRIEGLFTVPASGSTNYNIVLSCASGSCNFDDLRVFPFNGTLKTYVYDPNTLRLAAVLDERNYATLYEYDEEGKLIRVKKETERGIMTIQESRTSMQKLR